ncbi:unnamed protein product [Blepharisma stoltei]|uniref:PUM-HD domain-containing protein n=1 Tax=Blepharisma stoltei TaxID=1481888 RepID=A0AAU9J1U7_9CILI|nr:unnamed protein product [Blepharisma stoltei]
MEPKKKYKFPEKARSGTISDDLISRSWSISNESNNSDSRYNIVHTSVSQCFNDILDEDPALSYSGDIDSVSDFSINISSLPFLCRTKTGSKKIQQYIAKSRPEEIEQIVNVVSPHLGEIMTDLYGNYMCQTLFQSCSSTQRLYLLTRLKDDIIRVSRNPRGTHALQTAITLASLPEEELCYQRALQGHIIELSLETNGSHVIQRLLATLKNKHFIIREILGHVRELAIDKLGLCVIKKCINDPQIFSELLSHALVLMQDPYGNYALQHMIDQWQEECSFQIINCIRGKVAQLCNQKYSSNVMEKCMKEERMREEIINELIADDKMLSLLNCPYGCYVLRTAALESDLKQRERLKNAVNSAISMLHQKKLKQRWDEILSYLE